MQDENKIELPEAFANGPWISGQEVMDLFGITKEGLKAWRYKGIIAYSVFGGIIMYNQPWILWRLKNEWRWKRPIPGKIKEKE